MDPKENSSSSTTGGRKRPRSTRVSGGRHAATAKEVAETPEKRVKSGSTASSPLTTTESSPTPQPSRLSLRSAPATTTKATTTTPSTPSRRVDKVLVQDEQEDDNKIAPPVVAAQPSPVATSPLRRTSLRNKSTAAAATTTSTTKSTTTKSVTKKANDDNIKEKNKGESVDTTPKQEEAEQPKVASSVVDTLFPGTPVLRPWVRATIFLVVLILGQWVTISLWQADVHQTEATLQSKVDTVAREMSASHRHQISVLHESLDQAQQEARLFKAHVLQLQQEKTATASQHEQALQKVQQQAATAAAQHEEAWQAKLQTVQAQHQRALEHAQRLATELEDVRHEHQRQEAQWKVALEETRTQVQQQLQQEAASQVTALQQELSVVTDRLATVQAELDDVWSKARNLERNRDEWEALARRLEQELLPAAETRVAQAQAEVARLEQIVADDAAERERLRNMIHILEDEKEDLMVKMRQQQ